MSKETYPAEVSPEQLEQFSMSAALVVQSRRRMGNGSAYDQFLCGYVGDPQMREFQPIEMAAPSGQTYSYNSRVPGMVQSGFTPSGMFIHVRHADGWTPAWEDTDSDALKQSLRPPEDTPFEFFIASADLRTGTITEWRTVAGERYGQWGKENVKLHLYDRPDLSSVNGPAESSDPLDALILRRTQTIPTVTAQLTLDTSRGIWFKQDGLAEESLASAELLIAEVNELSELYGLTGQRLDELREQHERTAREMGQVVAQLSRTA